MSTMRAIGRTAVENSGICVQFAGSTSVGLVRQRNEDDFVVADLTNGRKYPQNCICKDKIAEKGTLFAVCDGMGGAAAGNVASHLALESLYSSLTKHPPSDNRDVLARRLMEAVEDASRRIYEIAQKDASKSGMGTTLTAGVLIDKVIIFAQVGDSRAYLLRDGKLKQLTQDQTLVNHLIKSGVLTREDAMYSEYSNIILQALGTSESIEVDLSFVELRKGDRLMICSDGLTGMVFDNIIEKLLIDCIDPYACCRTLINFANDSGGNDNATVIIADFEGDDLSHPSPNDIFGYIPYPLFYEPDTQPITHVDTPRPRPNKSRAGEMEKDESCAQPSTNLQSTGKLVTTVSFVTLIGSLFYLVLLVTSERIGRYIEQPIAEQMSLSEDVVYSEVVGRLSTTSDKRILSEGRIEEEPTEPIASIHPVSDSAKTSSVVSRISENSLRRVDTESNRHPLQPTVRKRLPMILIKSGIKP